MIVTKPANDTENDLLIGFEKEQLKIVCMGDNDDVLIEPHNGFWTHE